MCTHTCIHNATMDGSQFPVINGRERERERVDEMQINAWQTRLVGFVAYLIVPMHLLCYPDDSRIEKGLTTSRNEVCDLSFSPNDIFGRDSILASVSVCRRVTNYSKRSLGHGHTQGNHYN